MDDLTDPVTIVISSLVAKLWDKCGEVIVNTATGEVKKRWHQFGAV